MLNNITIGQYVPGRSLVHRMDPRAKLIITFLYVVAIFFIQSFVGYAAAALFVAASILASKLKLVFVLRSLKPLVFILVFTFVLNVLLTKGETVWWQWGPITLSREGVLQAVYLAIRLVLLVSATSVLTLTTAPMALTDAMESLMRPLGKIGFPAHELAMMMTIALRFIPTLLEETDKIMKAQKARGADFDSGNLMKKAKSMVPLLVPLFVSAFRRADELAMAMESRCYHGGEGRTRMKQLRFSKADAVGFLGFALAVALIAADCVRVALL